MDALVILALAGVVLIAVVVFVVTLANVTEALEDEPEVRRAVSDARVYGSGFIRRRPDGALERVDPAKVRVMWEYELMFKQLASAVFRITYASLREPTIVTNKGAPIATYVPWGSEYSVVRLAQTPRSTESDVGGGGSTATGQPSPSTPASRAKRGARAGRGQGVSAPAGSYSKAQQTGRPK